MQLASQDPEISQLSGHTLHKPCGGLHKHERHSLTSELKDDARENLQKIKNKIKILESPVSSCTPFMC